ncbi:HNH endonuclease signature motif containing protein [Brachybacterium sp. GPGPB12]|uniref:HNH endonuclease signature motif containing protein n=1 Tax=Brachybacterium sp. GPGPB12 TaxID=3023517 RepID=UPI0031344A96
MWDGECLVWIGSRDLSGYGRVKAEGLPPRGAHRAAWELANGQIPDGLVVRHKCDNPPCVRLEHLELGTAQDNVNDMIARGRAHWQKTPEETP